MPGGAERRQYGRITLDQPLEGWVGDVPVEIVEASVTGFRVVHATRFPPGNNSRIRVIWGTREMRFDCQIVRSMLFRLASSASEKSVYQTGIRLDGGDDDSERVLRDLIADRVIRALEEQKANWRGIPPIGGYVYQVGKGNRFRRCEFTDGRWRKTDTMVPQQPESGFTVSAELHPTQIDLLCQTYERTDAEGRRLTRILAELSIRKSEGTPVRRYEP